MRKFWFLVSYTLKKRVKSKSFVIANIIIAIVIILLANITSIIGAFGGSFDDLEVVYLYDNSTDMKASKYIMGDNDPEATGFEFELRTNFSDNEAFIESNLETANYLIVLNQSKLSFDAKIIGYDITLTNQNTLKILLNSAKNKIFLETADDEIKDNIEDYLTDVKINYQIKDQDESAIFRTMLGVISIFVTMPIFFMLIMIMQFVGSDIIEEKSSRCIEIIISNVKPTTHFSSKITGAIFFLIIQVLMMGAYGLLGLGILALTGKMTNSSGLVNIEQLSGIIDLSPELISSMLAKIPQILLVCTIFIILGFLLYLILIALTAAMSSSQEDFQQFQTPLMLIILAGFYISIFGLLYEGARFVQIMGYIPFFSPLIAPGLFITGEFTLVNTIVSAFILIGFDLIVIYFGIPLYKASILSYSQDKFFVRIKKLLKRTNENH